MVNRRERELQALTESTRKVEYMNTCGLSKETILNILVDTFKEENRKLSNMSDYQQGRYDMIMDLLHKIPIEEVRISSRLNYKKSTDK
jgi:hypothetical protein